MKITILDGYTLNPGDLDYAPLEKLGDLTVYDRTSPDQVIERAAGSEILLTNKVKLGEAEFAQLPDLKYVGVLATGYNVVDTEAARRHGIVVTNIPAYSTESVAQQIFALILTITNHAERYAAENREGKWCSSIDFMYTDSPIMELCGKTLGVVGYGHIGQAVARIANAFGMKVKAFSSKTQDAIGSYVIKSGLDELFQTCDIVCLCCPLTPDTKDMVNSKRLSLMKNTAILINTGRGPLVIEEDLAETLKSGKIAAAGLDVLSSEPPACDNPLIPLENCYITPHVAWASLEARQRLLAIAASNIEAFLSFSPLNVVN